MDKGNGRKAVPNKVVMSAVQMFGNHFLSALGIEIEGKIIEHIPTEIELIREERHVAEELFRLDDESILHLEYQSTFSFDNLVKLMEFDVLLYEQQLKKFRTVVILGPDISNVITVADFGAVVYSVEAIYLSKFDGDRLLVDLMEKVEQKWELTDEDLCRLILLPCMRTSIERSRRAEEVIQIFDHLADDEKKRVIRSLIIKLARKLLTDCEIDDGVVQVLEGRH